METGRKRAGSVRDELSGIDTPQASSSSPTSIASRRAFKKRRLTIDIPIPAVSQEDNTTPSSSQPDSLFDGDVTSEPDIAPALLHAPPIPGFFYTPSLRIPLALADAVVAHCLATYFVAPHVNQIMLFCRAGTGESPPTGLPPVFLDLLEQLSIILKPTLPAEIHTLLFPSSTTLARQAIINLYEPGEGITPHVDLLKRFGDGIIGVSFESGCVMQFAAVDEDEKHELYLPKRTVIVMSGDARYKWTHGIEKRTSDLVSGANEDGEATLSPVADRWLDRTMRLSITFRWLLPGADILS